MTNIPDSNISTEHQKPGDAMRPADTLDRDRGANPGQEPEDVEDRPSVGTVEPEDYPRDAPDS